MDHVKEMKEQMEANQMYLQSLELKYKESVHKTDLLNGQIKVLEEQNRDLIDKLNEANKVNATKDKRILELEAELAKLRNQTMNIYGLAKNPLGKYCINGLKFQRILHIILLEMHVVFLHTQMKNNLKNGLQLLNVL